VEFGNSVWEVPSWTVFYDICKLWVSRSYECYSDEHYLPVLLAYAGKQEETDCTGLIMNVDWEEGGPHPISYLPENITEATLRALRKPDLCDAAAALRRAPTHLPSCLRLNLSLRCV